MTMTRISLFVFGLLLANQVIAQAPQIAPFHYSNQDHSTLTTRQFQYDAVYNGLIRNQVPQELAKHILANGRVLFVGKCPICGPTENAIRDYTNLKLDTTHSQLADTTARGLVNDLPEVKQMAMREMITLFVAQHYQDLDMKKKHRRRIEAILKASRETGMDRKSSSFGGFCPSCDGACQMDEK